jgi:uncharacterized protein YciI
MTDSPPPVYFVLFHQPGPRWQAGISFREQPGVLEHVAYMGGFFDSGELVMGGPFLDNGGGMAVFHTATIEQALAIAEADPSVRSGLLTASVRPWVPAFHL